MKLYYSPLACSLADHIALREAGVEFTLERVDLRSKRLPDGTDFTSIVPKGYVPALVLEDGQILTENIAVLDWIAAEFPSLGVATPLRRTRVLESLTFISTELHRAFKPMWHASSDVDKDKARQVISSQLRYFADGLDTDYLFGTTPSVADFYLFVMLLWAVRFEVPTPDALIRLRKRIAARPAVHAAMSYEGLI